MSTLAVPTRPHTPSLARKAGWSAVASVCSLCGRLVTQIMIARMLGPEGLGRIAYMIWLIEIANLLVCFGLPSSLTRYLAELNGQGKAAEAIRFAQWVFVRYALLALIGSVGIGVLFRFSSQYAGLESALPVLMVLFLARGLETINHSDLAGRQRFDLLARINVVAAVSLVIGVAVGTVWFGVTGTLYGYVAGALVPAAYSFRILRGFTFGQKVAADLRRRVWKFTFNVWLLMLISAFVFSRMEIFFLERYWDAREVAMFTIGLTCGEMIRQVATMFCGAFMAHFSHLLGSGNHDLVQRQYLTSTRLMAFLLVPMAFGGAAIMPVLIPLLFGVEFAPAIPNAMVLTATSALAFSMNGSALVYAKERLGFVALGGLAGVVLTVLAGVFIVSRFGAWGAVWSRLFVQGFMITLGIWFITSRLRFSFPFRSLARTALAGGFCALCAWSLVRAVPHPIVALSLAILFGSLAYLVATRLLRVLELEDMGKLEKATKGVLHPFGSLLRLGLSIMHGESKCRS